MTTQLSLLPLHVIVSPLTYAYRGVLLALSCSTMLRYTQLYLLDLLQDLLYKISVSSLS